MRYQLTCTLSLVLLTNQLFLTSSAYASTQDISGIVHDSSTSVSITEIYPSPLTGESEWVELYNASTESAYLAGWTLEDTLTTPSTIYVFTTQLIKPGEYLVAELSSAKLNNAGDGVVLNDNQGDTVHSISYEGSSPGLSWSVAAGGGLYGSSPTPGSANAPQPSPSPSPTTTSTPSPSPGSTTSPTPSPEPSSNSSTSPTPNASPTPSPTAQNTTTKESEKTALAAITLTEVSACPTSGQQEWLELSNSSPDLFTITNWKITDEAGNARYISGTLPANSFQTFAWSGSLLNNAGDSLTLTTPLGNTVGSMEYDFCQSGLTLAWINSQWSLGEPTPGGAPQATANPTPTSSNADANTTQFTDSPLDTNVLGTTTTDGDPNNSNETISENATLLAALYSQLPPPQIRPLNQPNTPPASFPQTLSQTIGSSSPLGPINVILGGLSVFAAGVFTWYVQLETSPLSLAQRLFATSTLGGSHFLSELTK